MIDLYTYKEKTLLNVFSGSLAISPDSKKLFYTGGKRKTYIYEFETGKTTEKTWPQDIYEVHYKSGGELCVLGSGGKTYLYNTRTGESKVIINDSFNHVHFSPYSPHIICDASGGDKAYAYNLKTGKKFEMKRGRHAFAFTFLPDGKYFGRTESQDRVMRYFKLP